MNYIVITDDKISYHADATEAAKAVTPFEWERIRRPLSQLVPGDELDIDDNTSIIVLTGKNVELTR